MFFAQCIAVSQPNTPAISMLVSLPQWWPNKYKGKLWVINAMELALLCIFTMNALCHLIFLVALKFPILYWNARESLACHSVERVCLSGRGRLMWKAHFFSLLTSQSVPCRYSSGLNISSPLTCTSGCLLKGVPQFETRDIGWCGRHEPLSRS